MQRGYRGFNGLCHRVNFGLFRKRLITNDGSNGGINSGEVFVFVSVQLVRLGDGRVNRAVIRALVLQRGYCVFNGLCHCVNIVLFRKQLAANDGAEGGINSGEILVFVSVQLVRLGDGRVNLAVIRALVLQGGYRVFDDLCHRVNFGLFRKRLAANDGVDGGFDSGEVRVFVPVQRVCLGDGRVNRAVIRAFVLQRGNRGFNGLCHCVNIGLINSGFSLNNAIYCFIQRGDGFIGIHCQIRRNGF